MTSVGAMRIRVATLNCRRVGWVAGTERHEVDSVVAAIDALGPAPHILALSGTMGLRLYSSSALLALTQRLNTLLPDNDFYYPFPGERPGSRNPPGLWLSARHINVVAYHQMPHPSEPRPSHEVHHHTVEALVADSRLWLKAVHWLGSDSSHGSVIQSVIDSRLATVPAILLGDFAASLASEETPGSDWAERRANADALLRVLQAGFWDAGQVAAKLGESTADAADHTFDHVLVSHETSVRLVPRSYVVGLTEDGSAHAGVACELDFEFDPEAVGLRL